MGVHPWFKLGCGLCRAASSMVGTEPDPPPPHLLRRTLIVRRDWGGVRSDGEFYPNRLVVISSLGYVQLIVLNHVNQTMFICDSPRPKSSKVMFQRLGFSNAFKRISLNFFY